MLSKPVFDGAFCAFSIDDAEALRSLVERILHPSCRIAEIGSWLGNGSTRVILDALKPFPDARVLCVDTWQGTIGVDRHRQIADHYDVLSTFRRNVAPQVTQVDILVTDSISAAAMIKDSYFDLVFIDADHRYSTTKADIQAWRSKVKTGGIICGHDCEVRPTPAIKQAASLEQDAIHIQGMQFYDIHPGCIVAVDEAFDGKADLFAERMPSSLWAVTL